MLLLDIYVIVVTSALVQAQRNNTEK